MAETTLSHRIRNVLVGVPKVAFYSGGPRCPEDVCFPSVMRALSEYLGEDVGCFEVRTQSPECRFGCTYAYYMGVSGAAFKLTWGPGWQEDNVEIMYMSDEPAAPFQRAFEALGRECTIINNVDPGASEELFRQQIMASIDRGMPVIAFGVIGPPEACLVTGYDNAGEELIGWNFFQAMPEFSAGVELEPSGEFRVQAWYPKTEGLIVPGEKVARPDYRILHRKSLEWGLKVMRTPLVTAYGAPRANGIAAFDAWMSALLRDEEFIPGDAKGINLCFNVHDDAVGAIAGGRWYGSVYLARMAGMGPGAPELLRAAACFAGEHDLMWAAWAAVGGIGREPEKEASFARPEVRRKLVDIIRKSQALDEEAAMHIENGLKAYSPG
jgi:hypothetical protein